MRYRWVILGLCWLGYTIAMLQRLSIGPLAPFLKDSMVLSNSQIGMMTSAVFLGYLVALLPSGTAVDKLNEKYVLVLSEILGGIFVCCMFFVSRYYHALIVMAFCGAALGSILPATTKAILIWFPENERATAMGIKHTAINIGGIIASATLPPLALALSWNFAYLAMGLVGICVGCISLIFYKSAQSAASSDAPVQFVPSPRENTPLGNITTIIKNRDILLVTLVGFCAAVEFAVITYFVLFFKEALGYTVVISGFFLAVLEAGGGFGKPVLGFISDRFLHRSRKKTYLLITTTWSIVCIAMAFIQKGEPLWLTIALCVLVGASTIGWSGIHFTFIAELAGKALVGRATGISTFVLGLGALTWPPIIGKIIDISGNYKMAWLSIAILGIVASALLLLVRERPVSPSPAARHVQRS